MKNDELLINDLISIIVPVYKAEKFLRKCVDSLINQTYKNIEIILVDDGSPDNSPKLCDELANADKRIFVIHQENKGVSSARNTGLDNAHGDYVTFVDSDDYVDEIMYEEMMKYVSQYNCDFVMCDCIKEDGSNKQLYTHDIRKGYYDLTSLQKEYYPHLLMMENLEYPATISNCVCLIKRSNIEDNNLRYVEGVKYSEDLLFGAQALRCSNSFYYMKNKSFYHYVMNPQSATHVYSPDKWDNYKKLFNAIEKSFKNEKVFDFKTQIDYCLLFFVYNTVSDIYSVCLSDKEKYKLILSVLDDKNVRDMFHRIKVMKLNISFKLKVITMCYKYKKGIRLLIKKFS